MTPLAEACNDLKQWLPTINELITEPDTQPSIGRTQPGSAFPGNTMAFNLATDIDAMARETENNLRYTVTGHTMHRGGSDGNTERALDAISRLAEACDQHVIDTITKLVNRHITMAMQLPAIDLEQPWQLIRGRPCPRCTRTGQLRYRHRHHAPTELSCLTCCRHGEIVEGTVSDGVVQWDDGEVT